MVHRALLALGFHNGWRDVLLSVGLGFAALSGSQVYVFASFLSPLLASSLALSASQLALLNGLAIVGLQLTVAAGVVLDRWGPKVTLCIGTVANVASWIILSFLPERDSSSWIGLLLLLILASFGEGFLFLALFKTSVQLHPSGGGMAMGCVSATMSLSLAVSVASAQIANCDGADCWREYCRIFAVFSAVCGAIGFATLFLFRPENYPWLRSVTDVSAKEVSESTLLVNDSDRVSETLTGPDAPSTLLRSLRLFVHPAFLALFLAYFCAMGSSVTTISSGNDIWNAYLNSTHFISNNSSDLSFAFPEIASAFSYANAASNLLTGAVVGIFAARLSPRKYYIVTLYLVAICHLVIAVLFQIEHRSASLAILLAACLAALGAGFGAFLVLAAIRYNLALFLFYFLIFLSRSFAQTFGFLNFGIFLSWMQVAGSAASVVNPLLGASLFVATQSYAVFAWLWFALLVAAGTAMLLVPVTPYLR
jgi:MFS family permease